MSLRLFAVLARAVRAAAFLVAAGSALVAPSAARAQSADEKAVVAVIDNFFKGMLEHDTTLIRSTVAENARLVGTAMRDGTPVVTVTPMDRFVASIGGSQQKLDERTFKPEVRIDGNLATVWTFYTLHVDGNFIHCGFDAFHLLRVGSAWKIVNVADTRRTERCEPPKD